MSVQSVVGIYQVLAKLLKASPKPLTCVELYDFPEVRKYAADTNKVSDYLGHMYRRGFLNRAPSQGVGFARWAYGWKDPKLEPKITSRRAQPKLSVINTEATEKVRRTIAEKAAVKVVEDGDDIIIDTLHFTIRIHTK